MRKKNYIKTERSAKIVLWKNLLIAAGILLLLYFLVTRVMGEMGVVKYYRMKAQYYALTEEIAKLKQDNVQTQEGCRLSQKRSRVPGADCTR